MNIQIVKFISGDEIIAEVEEENNMIVLKNPVRLLADNSGQLTFVPYPLVCEKNTTLSIPVDKIIFRVGVGEQCNNGYREVFGHIVEPLKNIIV